VSDWRRWLLNFTTFINEGKRTNGGLGGEGMQAPIFLLGFMSNADAIPTNPNVYPPPPLPSQRIVDTTAIQKRNPYKIDIGAVFTAKVRGRDSLRQ